jgi:protein translocase SEC61 complex gamma subunit
MASRVASFWENTKRIFQLAKQPTRQEIWLQFKISMLGLFVVGGVGFFIRLLMTVITAQPVFNP